MSEFLIDTNCLLSYVTDRDKAQSDKMYELFNSAVKFENKIYIISNVLTEFVYVLDKVYQVDKKIISKMIRDLLKMPGIEHIQQYTPAEILKLWPHLISDYGDAVIAAASKELNYPVYTFDKKFYNQLRKIGLRTKLLG